MNKTEGGGLPRLPVLRQLGRRPSMATRTEIVGAELLLREDSDHGPAVELRERARREEEAALGLGGDGAPACVEASSGDVGLAGQRREAGV